MSRLLGAVLIVVALAAGSIGVLWAYLDFIGTEWDHCRHGGDCIAGWKMGAGFMVLAAVVGVVGFALLASPGR